MNFMYIGRVRKIEKVNPTQAHPHWELVLYHKGRGTTRVGDRVEAFHPGMLVCIPPLLPHREEATAPYESFCISLRELPGRSHEALFLVDPPHQPFHRAFELLHLEYAHRHAHWELRCHGILQVALSLIEGYGGRKENPLVEAMVHLLVENLSNPDFRLMDAFAGLHRSPWHLLRLFKKHKGKTPGRYLLDLRLDEAMKRLRHTPYAIGEIAAQLGFDDANYFSRFFSRKAGLSPKVYREAGR